MREFGLASSSAAGTGFILAEASCQYRSPLELTERVTIYARVCELRNTSFIFEYRAEAEDGRLAATARSVQVCYDHRTRCPIPMPTEWREAIFAYEPGLQVDAKL